MSEPDAQKPQDLQEPQNLQDSQEPIRDENPAPQPAASPAAPLSPGARLAAGREQHGWAIEQVAAHLKLATRQIAALERDDYAALPGMPIVRGFIRSYAKLLKIDAAPLLAQLGGETVLASESLRPKEGLATPFSEARLPSMSERPGLSSRWVVGVLLAVLLLAALWASRQDSGLFGAAPEPQANGEQAVSEEPVQEPLPPDMEPVNEPDAAPQPQQPLSGVPETSPPVPQAAGPLVLDVPAAPAVPVQPAAAGGANSLSIAVREESWIEVRPAGGGRSLVARLVPAGETVVVQVETPVDLIIGNVAGVDATLRGAPVELKGSTTTNVARLTLK